MLKVIDVDWNTEKKLALAFSDGVYGEADLTELFTRTPFNEIEDFQGFSLEADGGLRWGEHEVRANILYELLQNKQQSTVQELSVDDIEAVIKQASWESMKEGRPDILQAVIRAYVERFGHSQVIAKAGIKSRTSAYRSLKPETTPNFATLVQLGHAVIELATQKQVNKSMVSGV